MGLVNPGEGVGVSDPSAVRDALPDTGGIGKDKLSRQERMRALAVTLFFFTAVMLGPCCSAGVDIHLGTPTPTRQARTVVVGTPTPPSQAYVPLSP